MSLPFSIYFLKYELKAEMYFWFMLRFSSEYKLEEKENQMNDVFV